jgi:hypothetical protein
VPYHGNNTLEPFIESSSLELMVASSVKNENAMVRADGSIVRLWVQLLLLRVLADVADCFCRSPILETAQAVKSRKKPTTLV